MNKKFDWIGVDYGSKLAGTTVICHAKKDVLYLQDSTKGQDADAWITQFLDNNPFNKIYFDAPLSLPMAYFGKGDNYFYRACDKETKAMSPMFLGGLTARAMRLKAKLEKHEFIETYPSYLIKTIFEMTSIYTKKKKYEGQLNGFIEEQTKLTFHKYPKNWHEVDSVLCWISGLRAHNKEALEIGDKLEGFITV